MVTGNAFPCQGKTDHLMLGAKHLRVDGQLLVQIDVSNSQPLFQAVVAERCSVVCPTYKEVCEEGRLYEFLGEKTGLARKRFPPEIVSATLPQFYET